MTGIRIYSWEDDCPKDSGIDTLTIDVKERWRYQLGHPPMKKELGLGHFEIGNRKYSVSIILFPTIQDFLYRERSHEFCQPTRNDSNPDSIFHLRPYSPIQIH